MSTFKIYTAKDIPIKILGPRSIRISRIVMILLPLFGLFNSLINKVFSNELILLFWIFYLGIFLCAIGYSIYLINRLKVLGTLSFYESFITKRIGDYSENWDYNSIEVFSVRIHMRDMFFQKGKLGIRSYVLEIQFKDKTSQRLVISSVSIEKAEYNLEKTLQILSKTKGIEIMK